MACHASSDSNDWRNRTPYCEFIFTRPLANGLAAARQGARASYAISNSWGVLVPQARFEYEHEFEDDARATITALNLDPARNSFIVFNDAPDRDSFNIGAGLLFVLPNGWSPFIDYEGQVGYRDASRHRVTAGLRVEF